LRSVSEKARSQWAAKAAVRAEVFARDGACVLRDKGFGKCYGRLTPHHVRKASQGGTFTADNLVALCAWHNDLLEIDADAAKRAHTLGIVRRSGEAECGR